MMNITRRLLLKIAPLFFWRGSLSTFGESSVLGAQSGGELPFGPDFPKLDSLATGEWWTKGSIAATSRPNKNAKGKGKNASAANPPPAMDVPREEVVCFAYYTHQKGVLKMSAQLFPLKPGEDRQARLELKMSTGEWKEVAKADVLYPGWDAHFRLEG
jgi:hypothetical protein